MPNEKGYADSPPSPVRERSLMENGLEMTETVVCRLSSIPTRLRAIIERLEGPRAEKDTGRPDDAVSPVYFDRWNAANIRADRTTSDIYELLDRLDSLI